MTAPVLLVSPEDCGCGNAGASPRAQPGLLVSRPDLRQCCEPNMCPTCYQDGGHPANVDLDAIADRLGWPAPCPWAAGECEMVAERAVAGTDLPRPVCAFHGRCDSCARPLTPAEFGVVDLCGSCCPRDGVLADPIPGDGAVA